MGRSEELAFFKSVIFRDPMPFVVLSVYGPGGVGKTTLLRQFETICRESDVRFATVDGRYIQPSPDLFVSALCNSMGVDTLQEATSALAANGTAVLFVDTFEAIEPLDGWLRETFIPELPETILLVLFGRKRPTAGWRADVWQSLCRAIPLRNLSSVDCRTYLDSQTVPQDVHEQILKMTHGYPLALSLVAENFAQTGSIGTGPDPSLDIVSVLVDRFLESVEEPIHRDLLEICALVRMTTEALIANVLDKEMAPRLFTWLKSLSFMEITPFGLMPHDLARDAIATDLRWRNTDRYSELHHRVRAYYTDRLERATGSTQQLILFDYIYLHRDNPVMEPFFRWHSYAEAFSDTAYPDDLNEIVRIIEKHEGSEAAKWGRFWFERQRSAFQVMRDSVTPGQLKGLLVALDMADHTDIFQDPATAVAMEYLETHAPLRKGERATHFRFWMADDGYQSVTPIQSTIFVSIVQHYLTEPSLAYTFVPCSDPEFWAPMFEYARHPELVPVAYNVDGRRFGVFANDWRVMPPKPWLALLNEQEVPIKADQDYPRRKGDIVVLSQEGFEDNIVEALKAYTNPPRLAQNPLIRSRLVVERTDSGADISVRVARLKELLREAATSLIANSKDEKLYQALEACYFRPMRSQETAAEKVDVSIATFRRHIKAGSARVAALLWQLETGL